MSLQRTDTPLSAQSKSREPDKFALRKRHMKEGRGSQVTQLTKISLTNLPTIIVDSVDVTPHNLNPFVYEGGKERQISTLDTITKESFILVPQSIVKVDSQRFHATLQQQKQDTTTTTSQIHVRSFMDSSYADDLISGIEMMGGNTFQSDLVVEEYIRTATEASEVEPPAPKIPEHVSLTLQETETAFLLDVPSCTRLRGSEEGDVAEEDNRTYDYLTRGKGRNRKVLAVGVQTLPILLKTRDTETNKKYFQNSATFVSSWEMYDTMHAPDEEESDEEISEEDFDSDEEYGIDVGDTHRLNREVSQESYRLSNEDKQIHKLVKSKAFFDALLVIERILGNNTFNEQQKTFKNLYEVDLFNLDKVYKYKPAPLWIYANDNTDGQCVSAMAFNTHNEDIVAVAYGKYYYNDRNMHGIVMIWNFKNPRQPERHYNFCNPVTSIAFSKLNPNLLAVGLYNGHLSVVDVSKRDLTVIRENAVTSFEPLWSVVWFQQGEDEDIMASFGDGKVYKFQIRGGHKLKSTQIMMTAAAEGKLKGIHYMKKCESKEISINRYEEARCLVLHPADPYTYFVGTSEGVVHKCSTNYYNEHMDVFKAHDGAIHTMKFSPFTDKLYFTCGDDFRARLWADGINEPLITTAPSVVPVMDVDWNPVHPTVIASIKGSDILIWDMQRKMYESQSLTTCDKNGLNTVCRFSPNGRCLMVGDMAGNVRVFSMEDMPIPPFFPENLVSNALKKLLVTKPDLLKKLEKLGSLNFCKQSRSKYFN